MVVEKQFCVLPYLKFETYFSIGDFSVWESTPEGWKKHFAEDNTRFLEMYVDKDTKPIKGIPVVSCQSIHSYNDWETLVSILFFLITGTNLGYSSLYSENFYFELWKSFDNGKGGYTRVDKFFRRIASSQFSEKILPSQFVNWNNKPRLDINSLEFKFFKNEITKGFNFSLFRSLLYYMRTQFRDSYLFPEEADVQNFCSAFQCLLGVLDRRNVGELIADKLVSQLNLPAESRGEIKKWMIDFYEVRSIYTHGDKVTDERLSYLSQRHIDIAKRVFQILILKRCRGNGEKIYDEFLLKYFISNRVFGNIVKTLSKNQAKEELLTCQEKDLLEFSENLKNLYVNFDQKTIDFENKNKIKRALTTLIYIFEDLYSKILNDQEKREKYFLYPLTVIKGILETTADLEKAINEIGAHNLALDCSDPDHSKEEVTFREIITLGELLNAFANLKDVFLGHHRL
jgi:hypothetical protein